jgi:hypothetical protein
VPGEIFDDGPADGRTRPRVERTARTKSLSMIDRNEEQMILGERAMRPELDASLSVFKQRPVALLHLLETGMADHPKKSLLVALSLGVLLGWIIKRH